MSWIGTCPECGDIITYRRFEDDFPCPECGVMLEHEHDCLWDGEEETCTDILVRASPS